MVNNSANKANNQLSSQIIDCKKKDHGVWPKNPGSGLGQAQKCGRVKLVNGIPPPPPLLIIGSPLIVVYCLFEQFFQLYCKYSNLY